MSWSEDNLTSAEEIIHRGEFTKIGRFNSNPDQEAFWRTPELDNDVFVLPGNAVHLRRNDDRFFFIEPGGIVLHRAGSELSRKPVDLKGDQAWWFALKPALFEETLSTNRIHPFDMGGSIIMPVSVRIQLLRLVRNAALGVIDPLELDSQVSHLFRRICQIKANLPAETSGRRALTVTRRKQLIERTREYLSINYQKPYELKQLARDMGSSPFHLNRVFREVTGITPGTYVNRLRVGAVTEALMSETDKPLSDLASEAGFTSQSYMNRVVKKEAGMTPSRIRACA